MRTWIALIIGVVIGWLSNQGPSAEVEDLRRRLAIAEARNQELQARLDKALSQEAGTPRQAKPDRLQKIKGIGDVFASRLQAAGIMTFASLAEMDAARLKQIVQPEPWQKVEFESWLAEARELAQYNQNA